MKLFSYFIGIVFALSLLFVLCFGIQFGGLKWYGFFAKEKANIERQVYEESKSFAHGKADALAKHYQEYQQASSEDKLIIENVIRMEFGSFDETKLTNQALRVFLIQIRGY